MLWCKAMKYQIISKYLYTYQYVETLPNCDHNTLSPKIEHGGTHMKPHLSRAASTYSLQKQNTITSTFSTNQETRYDQPQKKETNNLFSCQSVSISNRISKLQLAGQKTRGSFYRLKKEQVFWGKSVSIRIECFQSWLDQKQQRTRQGFAVVPCLNLTVDLIIG